MHTSLLLALVVMTSVGFAVGGARAEDTPADVLADLPGGSARYPLRMLNGMETMRFDANKIIAYRGSATDNSGKHLLYAKRTLTADVLKVGPGGRDGAATREDAVSAQTSRMALGPSATYSEGQFKGLPLAGWYMPVYVGRAADRDAAGAVPAQLILTRMQSSQVINTPDTLAIDAGFDSRRSAPIAHFYDPLTGFRPMVCHGWPKPFCVWTRTAPGQFYIARDIAGTASTIEIDASDFVPPTGRLLRMQVIARSTGGTGDVSVQTGPRAGSGLEVVTLVRPGDVVRATVEFSLTSKRKFSLRVPSDVVVDLVALGFSMQQPS